MKTSDRRFEALPGEQVRPEGKSAYDGESGESKDDSIAEGEARLTPSGKQPGVLETGLV